MNTVSAQGAMHDSLTLFFNKVNHHFNCALPFSRHAAGRLLGSQIQETEAKHQHQHRKHDRVIVDDGEVHNRRHLAGGIMRQVVNHVFGRALSCFSSHK